MRVVWSTALIAPRPPHLTIIGTCISFTFLNPYSHQSNLMVMGPGKYSPGLFFRFGLPVTLVCLAAVVGVGWGLLELWSA